ncbi:DUF488 family protein, partial [Klebsiella pneumoniae]
LSAQYARRCGRVFFLGWGGGVGARANRPPLTLLYAAKNTEQNHARVLAAWLAALPVTI